MIRFNEDTGVFSLDTVHSSYRMQIREFGVLVHLYYGAFAGDSEMTEQIVLWDCGFAPNLYDSGTERTFSPDILPQEYTGFGNGDYRVCSLEVENSDGSNIADLRYESHKILAGKYALEALPAMFARNPKDAQTLEITLRDPVSQARAVLLYGVFPSLDIITRAVRIENAGNQTVRLRRVMSAQMDFPDMDEWMHFHGRHTMERVPSRTKIDYGIQAVESTRGASSHQHNPFVVLCQSQTTEDYGDCYGIALAYSGSFLCQAQRDQTGQVRLTMGIHPGQFCWELKSGESFTAPEVIMTYSEAGFSGMTHQLHEAMRSSLIRSKYARSPRPVLLNNWEATYFDFTASKLLQIARTAKEAGVELFVLDDGWFGKRDSDFSGLGDWVPNEKKLQGSLAALSEQIRAMGLKFGLWIEPEMVSEDSDLYRAHPDWCLRIPGREPLRGRYQLNLDITRPQARRCVMDQIFHVIDTCGISYIKWDMNRSVGNVYSAAYPPSRQGEVAHRYVLAVYEMMEELVSRYPDLLFENCAGGGGRFDAGMLYYSPQIWCSDNTDAADRLMIQYGTSFAYPAGTMGSHISVCPNHQTGRTTPLATRGTVARAGTFGFELDLDRLTDEEMKEVRRQIALYKENASLVFDGEYYRLSAPDSESSVAAWEFISRDRTCVLAEGVIQRAQSNGQVRRIYLRGLDKGAHYREKTDEYTPESGKAGSRVFTGAALMKAGLPLPSVSGDYQPFTLRFEKID